MPGYSGDEKSLSLDKDGILIKLSTSSGFSTELRYKPGDGVSYRDAHGRVEGHVNLQASVFPGRCPFSRSCCDSRAIQCDFFGGCEPPAAGPVQILCAAVNPNDNTQGDNASS